MKKICFLDTYACGDHDAEFQQLMKNLDDTYTHTIFPGDADVIVAYFCAVTSSTISKTALELVHISKAKKPDAIFIVAGCIVNALGKDYFLSLDYVDYAIYRDNFVQDVLDILVQRKAEKEYFLGKNNVRFSINIVGGCVRKGGYCSFCKQNYLCVPVKSLPIDEVLEIANEVTKSPSIRVIRLTGLNTCNYGIDIGDKKQKLHVLIQELSKLEKVKLIEVHALTIGDMYEELADEIASNPKVRFISFGTQSGSNEMLKIMNTHYTVEQIQYYLDKFSHKAVYTIVVPGHPGETEETMQTTIDFIKRNKLWHIHISPFMNTFGTPSYSMEQLPKEKYNAYVNMVVATVNELRKDFLEYFTNNMVEAYFRGYSYNERKNTAHISAYPQNFHGTLDCYIENPSDSEVCELAKKLQTGDKIKVHITGFDEVHSSEPSLLFDKLEVI